MTAPSEALNLMGAKAAAVGATPLGKRQIDLDVVRGLAILLAIGWHFNHEPTGSLIIDALTAPGRAFGWAGVDIFFVLSGFLIGGMIFKEVEAHGDFQYGRFFVRRALRLWPSLYLLLAFMMIGSRHDWLAFAPQIGLHVANYFQPAHGDHLWSLAVEEQFYLVAGLGTLAVLALHFDPRRLWIVLVAMLICAPILRAVAVATHAPPVAIQWQTQYRMDALAAGVLMAHTLIWRPDLFAKALRRRRLWLVIGAGCFAFLAFTSKTGPLGMIAGFTLSWTAGVALIMAVYKSGAERVAPPVWRAMAQLGLISYSAYLWHVPVGKAAAQILSRLHLVNPGVVLTAEYGLTILVAYLGLIFVERPAIHLRDRLMPARKVGARREATMAPLIAQAGE